VNGRILDLGSARSDRVIPSASFARGCVVRFDYLELVVEEIGTLARGPMGRPGREVDDKAHGEGMRLGF
jgi:hypothetical protein